MNTFSRLSLFILVCLGFALMLGIATAEAIKAGLNYEIDPAQDLYSENQEITLTFTLTVDGVPRAGEKLNITATGLTVITTTPSSLITNSSGQVIMKVKLGTTTVARNVTATWAKLNSITTTADFNLKKPPPERPIIVVLTPEPKDQPKDVIPKDAIKVGTTFTQTIEIRDVADLSAWQMDIVFNPAILKLVDVTEGGFLQSDGINAFFPSVDLAASNANGRLSVSQARIGRRPNATPPPPNVLFKPSPPGVSRKGTTGNGDLVTLTFEVLEFAEEPLGIHNVQLGNSKEERISYSILVTDLIVVTHQFPAEDVNRDGHVNVQDLIIVAGSLRTVPINPRADVNDDGFVNVLDLVAVYSSPIWTDKPVTVQKVRNPNKASLAAPAASIENLTPATIQGWINLAQVEDDGSIIFDRGIANLESLLASRVPSKTRLLLNYPNPFNPETWIPYQLAESTDVTVTIHSMNGSLIRTLALGHQAAGTYQSKSEAAYWDGRNEFGEQVASGLYFYTLTAGNFSATAKMLVRK